MPLNRSQRLLVVCCAVAATLTAVPVPRGIARQLNATVPAAPDARPTAVPGVAAAIGAAGGAGPAVSRPPRRVVGDRPGRPAGVARRATLGGKGAPSRGKPAYLPRRLLVGFKRWATPRARARALAAAGARRVGRAGGATVVVVLGPDPNPEAAAARLATRPGVAFATPDYVRSAHDCGECWQLGPSRTARPAGAGAEPAPVGFGTGAAALHAAGLRGEGSVVAVLDSGVAEVPDLAGKVLQRRSCVARWGGARCVGSGGIASSHGTMVASLIAANDDGAGTTGVAPGARIKSWQVDGGGEILSSAIIAALDEATADPDVDVVNMSFGGPAFSEAELAAVHRALRAGKTLVASAGNDGSYQPQYPAAYPGVIAVGATDQAGRVAPFSSYGKVDVVAPGVCLPAAAPRPVTGDESCAAPRMRGVALVSGTSFAAPVVSGVLALRRGGSPLRDRLGLAGTAALATSCAAPCRAGADDRKREGHGIVDAVAWNASFASGAAPYLVVEADPQLALVPAARSITWRAYLLRSGGAVPAPEPARFAGLVPGSAGFTQAEPGAWVAELRGHPAPAAAGVQAAGPGPGGTAAIETVTIGRVGATTAVRLLRPDDQAPGVPLTGSGPWLIRDTLQGGGTGPAATADLDDVHLLRLDAGQTVRVELRGPPNVALGAALFAPGTTDVMGRLDRIVASTGRPDLRGVARLTYTVGAGGDWLLDIYAQGLETDAPASGEYLLVVSAA